LYCPTYPETFEEEDTYDIGVVGGTYKCGLDSRANKVEAVTEPEDWIVVAKSILNDFHKGTLSNAKPELMAEAICGRRSA
jgi:hypothetical protein